MRSSAPALVNVGLGRRAANELGNPWCIVACGYGDERSVRALVWMLNANIPSRLLEVPLLRITKENDEERFELVAQA